MSVVERPPYNTPVLGLPVPGDGGPADGPGDIGALADALDQHAAQGQFGWAPGDLKMTAVQAAPAGWLLCQGQAVSRTVYQGLFAAIGTAYGAGDGSTTFNLPNFQDTMPVGASGSRPRGARGGSASVVLNAYQSGVNPNGGTGWQSNDHSHVVPGQWTGGENQGHVHTFYGGQLSVPVSASWVFNSDTVAGPATGAFAAVAYTAVGSTDGPNVDHQHYVNAIATGGVSTNHFHQLNPRDADVAHENMPPYVAVNVMIKT